MGRATACVKLTFACVKRNGSAPRPGDRGLEKVRHFEVRAYGNGNRAGAATEAERGVTRHTGSGAGNGMNYGAPEASEPPVPWSRLAQIRRHGRCGGRLRALLFQSAF